MHEHVDLGVDREPDLAQPVDGLPEPLAAPATLRGHRRLERVVVGVHPEAEDVQLPFPQAEVARHEGIDLDARDQGHPVRDRGRGDDVAIAGEGVVVGQREDAHAGLERRLARGRRG